MTPKTSVKKQLQRQLLPKKLPLKLQQTTNPKLNESQKRKPPSRKLPSKPSVTEKPSRTRHLLSVASASSNGKLNQTSDTLRTCLALLVLALVVASATGRRKLRSRIRTTQARIST